MAGVGATPGVDGGPGGKRARRFSDASSEENIKETARRIGVKEVSGPDPAAIPATKPSPSSKMVKGATPGVDGGQGGGKRVVQSPLGTPSCRIFSCCIERRREER